MIDWLCATSPPTDCSRNLYSTLQKVSTELQSHSERTPGMAVSIVEARRRLAGEETSDLLSMPHNDLLEGAIVLEEFSKVEREREREREIFIIVELLMKICRFFPCRRLLPCSLQRKLHQCSPSLHLNTYIAILIFYHNCSIIILHSFFFLFVLFSISMHGMK